MKLLKLTRSFLFRILAFNVLLISLIIFILSAILYFKFKEIGINIVRESILDRLYQTSYSTAYLQDASLGVIAQVYMDDDITAVLNSKDLEESAALYGLKNKLQRIVNASDFVESISVYDGASNNFFSTADYSPESEKEYLFNYVNDKKRNDELASGLHPTPRIVEGNLSFNKTEQVPVYTYIMYNNYKSDTRPEKGVILNVKEDWMRNVIKSAGANYLGDVFILNQDGIVMSHTSQDMFLKDLSSQDYVKKVFQSNNTGYFETDIDNIHSLVTFVSSDQLGWKFISVLPYSAVVKDMQRIRDYTLLAGLAILLLGITLSYVLARRASFPINRLKQKVSELIPAGNKPLGDIEYIASGLDEAATSIHTLEEIKKEKDVLDKEIFLRNLLLDRKDVKNRGSELHNLLIDPGRATIVVIFSIDGLHEQYDEKSEYLNMIKLNISALACKALSATYAVEAVDTGEDFIILLANTKGGTQSAEENNLRPYLVEIQNAVQSQYGVSVTAVLGCIADNPGELGHSYREAVNYFDYRLLIGHQSIITYSYVLSIQEKEYIFPEGMGKNLIEALKLCRMDQAKQIFTQIVDSASKHGINATHSAIIHLAIAISNTLQTLKTHFNMEDINNMSVVSLVEQVNMMETMEQTTEFFTGYFKKVIEAINKQHNTKMAMLVPNVKKHIETSYMDPSLSLKSIAGMNHISTAYLGKLFKDTVGESVSEYINQVRLNESVKLLSLNSLTINEIIEKTGNTSTLFFRCFRKTFGITPNEYRRKIQNPTNRNINIAM